MQDQLNDIVPSSADSGKVKRAVLLSTLFVVFFTISPFIHIAGKWIYAMYLFSPVVVAWVAFTILKKGKPSSGSFEHRFYEDAEIFRNGKEEINS